MPRDAAALERYTLQRENFDRALARLGEVLTRSEDDVVRDSVIQRFEFTFEMAWKTLFRYLQMKGEKVAAKAWDVLPVAFEAGLLDDAEAWDRMRDYRNDTSHEYNEAMAMKVSAFVRTTGFPAMQRLQAEMARRQ
jgi:nucleotidyltransferase substrate binding protein (TIGR01987 family)